MVALDRQHREPNPSPSLRDGAPLMEQAVPRIRAVIPATHHALRGVSRNQPNGLIPREKSHDIK